MVLNLESGDTIVGGLGSDTLTFSWDATTNLNGVSGVEIITLGAVASTSLTILDTLVASGARVTVSGLNVTTAFTWNGAAETDGNQFITGPAAVVSTITGGTGNDSITGSTGADSLTGGAGADTITGSAGIDTITGGGGNDDIALTGAGADTAADRVMFSGGTTLALQTTNNGFDTITGFVTGSDLLNVALLGDGTVPSGSAAITAAGAQEALTSDRAIVITATGAAANLTTNGTAVVTDFTSLSQVAAYLNERFTTTAGGSQVFVINTSATNSYVYSYLDAATAGIVTAELLLVGQVTNAGTALTAANVIYA
jgi:Ca2+-binding RTX toxin-like protein